MYTFQGTILLERALLLLKMFETLLHSLATSHRDLLIRFIIPLLSILMSSKDHEEYSTHSQLHSVGHLLQFLLKVEKFYLLLLLVEIKLSSSV